MKNLYQELNVNHPLRGLNFSKARYKIVGTNTFVPHIRSDFKAVVPYKLLANFEFGKSKEPIALVKIITSNSANVRIKKLMRASNSFGISLKSERDITGLKLEILDVKNSDKLQERAKIPSEGKVPTASIMPQFTSDRSFPYSNGKNIAPIYLFEHSSKIIAGSYLSRKDIIFEKEIELDELACAAIGLYYAEGGKTRASFTNSHPRIINTFLDFLERITNVKREKISASINCSKDSVPKRRNLEDFWSSQTGIQNFQRKLHIGNYVKSPCGILELYLGSNLIKEFICGMFPLVFEKRDIDTIGIMRGVLSGDGSPILQTKTFITHHIATDKNCLEFEERFIDKIFKGNVSTIKKINQGKTVLYNSWGDNLKFLSLDPYKYNLFNRLKFAEQFLNLRATKIFADINGGDVVKGVDIARYNMKPIMLFKNLNYLKLNQISPKPNKRYEITLTAEGKSVQEKLRNFIKNTFPLYKKDIEDLKQTLEKFNLS